MKGFFRPVAVVIALMMLWTQSGCSQSNVPASVPDNPSSSSLPVGLSLPSVEHIPWDSTILERNIVQQRLLQQGLSIPEGRLSSPGRRCRSSKPAGGSYHAHQRGGLSMYLPFRGICRR